MVPLEIVQKGEERDVKNNNNNIVKYDKEKYKEMEVDAVETVLGCFGFDRTVYENPKNNKKKKNKSYNELQEERIKDIQAELWLRHRFQMLHVLISWPDPAEVGTIHGFNFLGRFYFFVCVVCLFLRLSLFQPVLLPPR
jgi:hypothetical protein